MPIVVREMVSVGTGLQLLTYTPTTETMVEAVELRDRDHPCFARILVASKGSGEAGVMLEGGPTIHPDGGIHWAGRLTLGAEQEIRGCINHPNPDDRLILTLQVSK